MVWSSIENIYAASRTPAKLTAEDFIFIAKNGEKRDFFEESKTEDVYWFCLSTSTDVKEKKSSYIFNQPRSETEKHRGLCEKTIW